MDELAQAQATLGRSIDRARAGEDPQLAGIVREKGEQMVGLLFGLLRSRQATLRRLTGAKEMPQAPVRLQQQAA